MSRPFAQKKSAAALVEGLLRDEHQPYAAMIEIADRCNEVCVHCYQVQGQKGEMSTADVERVLRELAEMGILFLTFSGGEPTLRKDFLHLVGYARGLGFAVKIYSNGINIDAALAAELGALAVQEVQISLYSHQAELHDWVTRVPGSFDRTVAAARHLLAEGVKVVLKTPLMSVNAGAIDEWVDFVTGLGADYSIDPHVDPREDGDRSPEGLRASDAVYLETHRDSSKFRPMSEAPEKDLDASLCGACSGSVHVEANGELRPCTQMTVPVGHVLGEGGVRRAIAEDPSARAIRGLTWRDVHGCRDCDLSAYCSRCFANAAAESGDALGPYESACRVARLNYEVVHGEAPALSDPDGLGRRDALGPYRRVAPGRFALAADEVAEGDESFAENHPWVRRTLDPAHAPLAPIRPGELVQIRRPGKKRVRVERVPESSPISD